MRITVWCTLLLIALLVAFNCTPKQVIGYQQNRPADAKDSSERGSKIKDEEYSPAVETLINYARSTTAEFGADILIRIADSKAITNKPRKRELLEDAFRLAGRAQQPIRRAALTGTRVDTRSGYLSSAFNLKLDTLSLQCRAVKAMSSVDPEKARELFGQIPKPRLEPLDCKDALVYDVSDFYETLTDVVRATFKPQETLRGEHISFVEQYVDSMASPVQIEPLAKTILSLKTSRAQLQSLLHSFSVALSRISGDDRSFSVPWASGAGSIARMAEICKGKKILTDELLESFRAYLVKHITASRCADTAAKSDQRSREAAQIDFFNGNLRFAGYLSKESIRPINDDDIKPAKIEGAAKYYEYWESPKSKALLSRIRKLRFSPTGKPLSDTEKQEAEWQWQLAQSLTDLKSWRADDEKSEADYFHQKCILFNALLEIVPASHTRDDIMYDFVAFVSDSNLQKDSPEEWFLHANAILNKAHSYQGDERSKMLEALSKSKSAVIYLYAELERLTAK